MSAATAHSDVRSAAQMLQAGRARTLMTPTPSSRRDTQQPTKLGAIQRRRRNPNKHDRRDGAVAPEARAQIDWVI